MIKFKHHNCPNIFAPGWTRGGWEEGAGWKRLKSTRAEVNINDDLIEISYWSQILWKFLLLGEIMMIRVMFWWREIFQGHDNDNDDENVFVKVCWARLQREWSRGVFQSNVRGCHQAEEEGEIKSEETTEKRINYYLSMSFSTTCKKMFLLVLDWRWLGDSLCPWLQTTATAG